MISQIAKEDTDVMKSTVVSIGDMALAFEEDKVIVLFGPKAPAELKEISIIHKTESLNAGALGDARQFIVDDAVYDIVRIGSAAMTNLVELGHLSVYFAEPPAEILPGSIYVQPGQIPAFYVGSTIEIR